MNKRKKFQISEDIDRGITEVITAVKNNAGMFRYEVMSLSRIEIDPNNPRELLLTEQDIKLGISADDVNNATKEREKEDLESLSYTIKHNGIINPIVVYKQEDKYRIIAGERRFLASILAGKTDIHAKILDKKPDGLDLRLIQWIENNERQDLSLSEKLRNLEAIVKAYKARDNSEHITIEGLKKLTGLSKTQAAEYLIILNCSYDIRKYIDTGEINNLKKAVLIANIADPALRENVLSACVRGEPIAILKKMILENKRVLKTDLATVSNGKRGRAATFINLGRTRNIVVIRKILEIVLLHPDYTKYNANFDNIDWSDYKKISFVFHKLLTILEENTK